jgi:hypothetical protein
LGKGKIYLCNKRKYNQLMIFNKIIELINAKYKGKNIGALIEESDPKIIIIIPAVLILRSIDNHNYDIIKDYIYNFKKDNIFISVKETIRKVYKKIKDPYYAYNLFEKLLLFNEEKEEDEIDKKIFTAVDRVAHKTLHKEKDEKNNKICQIYKDLNDFEFKEGDKSIGYNNIDKLINSLKEKKPYIEFIAIKTIFISIKNITQELINIYYKISEQMDLNLNLNIITDENEIYDDETDMIEINPKIFEILFNDYIFMSNRCSFLENYFIESFNNFRNKHKIDFTLSDLFSDIFWNWIFA